MMVIRNYDRVTQSLENLKKYFPDIYNISIQVHPQKRREFRAVIELRWRRKLLVACKEATTYDEALERAEEAMFKQLEREKAKFKKQMKRISYSSFEQIAA